MFKFLREEKEYVSCDWLENGIHFCHKGIFHCPEYIHGKNYIPVVSVGTDNSYDFKAYFKAKKQDKKRIKKGIVPDRCEGCLQLKSDTWSKKLQIKKIAISSVSKCNSDCIYCPDHENRQQINKRKDVLVYNFLKKCIKKNLISKDCHIEWGGGEPTIADEFDKISYLFLENNLVGDFCIHTSGVKFADVLIKYIKEWSNKKYRKRMEDCHLSHGIVISVDCGSRELYKQIKSFDNFDKVWKNIALYCAAQSNNQSDVRVKYIVIPGLNDNIDEFEKFLKKAVEVKVKWIILDIENNWYNENNSNIDEIRKELKIIKNMTKCCEKYDLKISYYSSFCYLMERYNDIYETL